jgi:predicted nucleic acid-binding protein
LSLDSFTAFLDASVLYPAPQRDLLLELAVADLYRAKWSNTVHEEWITAVLRTRHDLTRAQLERTRDLMDVHVRDALVTDFEQLMSIFESPDSDDRHVLAAAVKGRADLIVTRNLKDFPARELNRWGIEAQQPDDFLVNQFHLSQPSFLQAVKTVRMRLRNPSKSVEDYLDTLRAQGLFATVRAIEPFNQFI